MCSAGRRPHGPDLRRPSGAARISAADGSSEKVTESERHGLARARAAVAAPWGERRSAARKAIAGEEGTIQAFVAWHFVDLLSELEEDGAQARAVTDEAARLVEAHVKRRRSRESRTRRDSSARLRRSETARPRPRTATSTRRSRSREVAAQAEFLSRLVVVSLDLSHTQSKCARQESNLPANRQVFPAGGSTGGSTPRTRTGTKTAKSPLRTLRLLARRG